MREMPYIEPYRIDGRRDGGRGILDEFREFLMLVEDVAVEVVEAVEVE